MTIHGQDKTVYLPYIFLPSSICVMVIFPDDRIYTCNEVVRMRKLSSGKDQERMFPLFSALQSRSGEGRSSILVLTQEAPGIVSERLLLDPLLQHPLIYRRSDFHSRSKIHLYSFYIQELMVAL